MRYCRSASSVRRKLSNFWLLLWNHWTEFNETYQEATSKCPLPSLCFWADRSNKMATLAYDLLRHFRHSLFSKLIRKQHLNVLYQVCVCFFFWGGGGGDRTNKLTALAYDWLRYFQLLLGNCWTEFNETWQEARSQWPLSTLCFQADWKTRWPPWPLIGRDISDFSSETAKQFNDSWQEAISQGPLPSLVFRAEV